MSAFRHRLARNTAGTASAPLHPLGVVMINPSKATEHFVDDKTSNDNTIRSLLRIADANGFDGILVANVSPFVATDPNDLIRAINAGADVWDAVKNEQALAGVAARCEVVAVGWGAAPLKHPHLDRRTSEVRAFLLGRKPVLHCFGKTKDGWPRHPLYLPTTTPLQVFAQRDGR